MTSRQTNTKLGMACVPRHFISCPLLLCLSCCSSIHRATHSFSFANITGISHQLPLLLIYLKLCSRRALHQMWTLGEAGGEGWINLEAKMGTVSGRNLFIYWWKEREWQWNGLENQKDDDGEIWKFQQLENLWRYLVSTIDLVWLMVIVVDSESKVVPVVVVVGLFWLFLALGGVVVVEVGAELPR